MDRRRFAAINERNIELKRLFGINLALNFSHANPGALFVPEGSDRCCQYFRRDGRGSVFELGHNLNSSGLSLHLAIVLSKDSFPALSVSRAILTEAVASLAASVAAMEELLA